MNNTPTNPTDPAFAGPNDQGYQRGMTKRELFTMAAMQGLCANAVPGQHRKFESLAIEAVLYADETIKALNEM